VRRVALILLAVVLMPSMATAAWYRCAFDGRTRSVCCCPMTPGQRQKAPIHEVALREACCCTITQVASRTPTAQNHAPAPLAPPPATAAIATAVAPPPAPPPLAALDRPRAQGDPPASLLARRCSLLL
jgi:hypothetical protein